MRMSTNLRVAIIVLNLFCLPVNVHTILNGVHRYQEHEAGGGSIIALGALAFVWCLSAALINTMVVLRGKKP
jgi:hypothetical protein